MRFILLAWPPLRYATALLALLVAGCTYAHGDDAPVPCNDATPDLATYKNVISPIFDQHCRSCHGATYNQPGDARNYGGEIPFRDYQDIKAYGNTTYLICCIEHNGCANMPKIGEKLSDCDIARIKAWVAAGEPNN